jgi:peptidoglycan/xylan/chitin deacetylase (PgdA/CDA1 family)/ketosteroid isomerase-like protein
LVTIDDLPFAATDLHREPAERTALTERMLAALARHDIHAVALVTWARARGSHDEQLLLRWLQAGHELGNHSSGHLDYTRTASERYLDDIESARRRLAELLAKQGKNVRFFRFPFLREGDTPEKLQAMRDYLSKSGQRNLPVTLDTQDWKFERPWVEARRRDDRRAMDRVAKEYAASLLSDVDAQQALGDELLGRRAPAILLLHASEVSAAQWGALFCQLRARGYRFAQADEVLADPAFAELPPYVGDHGPGLWDRLLALRRADKARKEISELLQRQAAAWTRGDLDDFVSAYTEDVSFASPSGITKGRDDVLARYRKKYGSDPSTMGALTLEIIELRLAQGSEFTRTGGAVPSRVHAASVIAKWKLVWPDKSEKSGLTSLYFERRGDGWRIAHDASM